MIAGIGLYLIENWFFTEFVWFLETDLEWCLPFLNRLSRLTKNSAKGKEYTWKRGKVFYLQYDVNGKRFVQSLKAEIEKRLRTKQEILEPALASDTKEKVMFNVASARKLLTIKSIKLSKAWTLFLETSTRPDSGPETLRGYKRFFYVFYNGLQ